MEIIHRLCFAGNTAPDAEVVHKLVGYVICESGRDAKAGAARDANQLKTTSTKRFTPFADIVDPTPTFRSFLLQLLLQSK